MIQPAYFDNEGNNYLLGAVRSQISDDQTAKKDGQVALKMTFDMPAGPDFYAGWYFLDSEGTIDLSGREMVEFDLKTTPGIDPSIVQVGIRSGNVPASSNHAKIFLSELGIREFPAGRFIHVKIPVALLLEREPNVDLKHIKDAFIIGLVGPDKPIRHESLWVSGFSWERGYTRVSDMLRIPTPALFDTAQWELRPDALAVLDRIARTLKDSPGRKIRVEGHTDSRGSDTLNMNLSRRRAQTVADHLVQKAALDPAKVIVEGFGKTRPLVPNDTTENMQKNRRVEVLFESDNTTPLN